MDVFECIQNRRSIRLFASEKDISDVQIKTILNAARMAPSAGNVQEWFFFVIKNQTLKDRLASAAYNQIFIATAPIIIVYFANIDDITKNYGNRGKTVYALQDCGAAVQNILLAAHALGLGTCWIGAFDEKKVEETLQVKENLRALALIPLGYPAEKPKMHKRKELTEIIKYVE